MDKAANVTERSDGVVLIVDDDESIRDALEAALAADACRTASVSDGTEALAWLHGHDAPSLILLDLMMPVMDGWQVLDALERDARLAQVPVVVMTAFGRDLGRAASLPVLQKPIELTDLLSIVGKYQCATM